MSKTDTQKSSPTLTEARRLHKLGFAVHWLKSRDKMPVNAGWTTGPRAEWDKLKSTYSETLNVGVRLGKASKINDTGYLAVIDVDVKSKDEAHRKAALAAVKKLTGGVAMPVVLSGRGNGSRHYYCVTKKPFEPYDFAKSSELVKVHMPSVKIPSKRDKENLNEKELALGYRIRPAWEISVMSEGRQVVLPPSIHPDSGKPYLWKVGLDDIDALPCLDIGGGEKSPAPKREAKVTDKAPSDAKFSFTPSKVDLGLVEISKRIRNGILTGEDVDDRSAFLLPACSALVSADLTRDEILSVLTEPKTFLGACAYEHAKTSNRQRAARWVWRYTLEKVMSERDPTTMFEDVSTRPRPEKISSEKRKEQDEEFDAQNLARDNGFYILGKNGALNPDYDALFKEFVSKYPYKMITDMKSLFTWTGTHYVDVNHFDVKAFAEDHFEPKPCERFRTEFYSKVLANRLATRAFFSDSTEGKFNFKNGVIDVSDAVAGIPALQPHSPGFGFRAVLPYAYDPEAKCPFFTSWLKSVMVGDRELLAILQEYMGYVVRGGEYKYHKALWLDGTGRNGKSTFIDILKALIGQDNFSTVSIKALIQDKFAAVALDGKIANFSEETSPQDLTDSGPFKNLTGDGDMPAQKKFGDIYNFRNRAKLIMTYNQIPDLKDLSHGMLSRPLVIPFRKVISESEQDRNIKMKLLGELPGIFNFALRGWRRLEHQGGFTRSQISEAALKKTAEESCNAFQWVENYVEVDETSDREFSIRDLFTSYRGQEKYAYTYHKFEKRASAHPALRDHRFHTRKGNVFRGLKIR